MSEEGKAEAIEFEACGHRYRLRVFRRVNVGLENEGWAHEQEATAELLLASGFAPASKLTEQIQANEALTAANGSLGEKLGELSVAQQIERADAGRQLAAAKEARDGSQAALEESLRVRRELETERDELTRRLGDEATKAYRLWHDCDCLPGWKSLNEMGKHNPRCDMHPDDWRSFPLTWPKCDVGNFCSNPPMPGSKKCIDHQPAPAPPPEGPASPVAEGGRKGFKVGDSVLHGALTGLVTCVHEKGRYSVQWDDDGAIGLVEAHEIEQRYKSPPTPGGHGPTEGPGEMNKWLEIAVRQANDSEKADSEVWHRHFITLAVENCVRGIRALAAELARQQGEKP